MDPLQPKVLGGWTLGKELGTGGNGVVFEVTKSSTLAALKIIHKQHWNNDRLKRFVDEIEALRRCKDIPGVLQLIDSSVPDSPNVKNPPWFVMQLATPLEKALGSSSDLEHVVCAIRDIALTLSIVHERGIAHRDIKPSNLFHLSDSWMVGDFGLAQFSDKSSKTKEHEKVGPMHYIAPEMLNDAANADGMCADVYSLAKTLWVLCTGQAYPLPGHHRVGEPVFSIASYATDKGAAGLDPLLDRATEMQPNLRPTMVQFAKELSAWLHPRIETDSIGPQSDLDLSEFAIYLGGLKQRLENGNIERSRKEAWREETGKRIRERFRNLGSSLEAALKDANFISVNFAIDNVSWGFYVTSQVAYDPSVDWATAGKAVGITSQVQIHEIGHNGYVGLSAAHICKTISAGSKGWPEEVLWERKISFLAEGAEEELLIAELEIEMKKVLRSCVAEVVRRSMIL